MTRNVANTPIFLVNTLNFPIAKILYIWNEISNFPDAAIKKIK